MRPAHCTLLIILAIALGELSPAEESNVGFGGIWIVDIKGAIGPATSDYILRAFEAARSRYHTRRSASGHAAAVYADTDGSRPGSKFHYRLSIAYRSD